MGRVLSALFGDLGSGVGWIWVLPKPGLLIKNFLFFGEKQYQIIPMYHNDNNTFHPSENQTRD